MTRNFSVAILLIIFAIVSTFTFYREKSFAEVPAPTALPSVTNASEILSNAREHNDNFISSTTTEVSSVFKNMDWHFNKWQNRPAIIDISDRGVNLLFNSPELVFALRRGIFFNWGDEHVFSDDTTETSYQIQRCGSDSASISYISSLKKDKSQQQSGSFTINKKP